jgi:hypothetical protein
LEACFNIINKKLRHGKEWHGGRGKKFPIQSSRGNYLYIDTFCFAKGPLEAGGIARQQETM